MQTKTVPDYTAFDDTDWATLSHASKQAACSIVCTAAEGGVNYWATIAGYKWMVRDEDGEGGACCSATTPTPCCATRRTRTRSASPCASTVPPSCAGSPSSRTAACAGARRRRSLRGLARSTWSSRARTPIWTPETPTASRRLRSSARSCTGEPQRRAGACARPARPRRAGRGDGGRALPRVHPQGPVYLPATPSCGRATRNARSELRRHGVPVPRR